MLFERAIAAILISAALLSCTTLLDREDSKIDFSDHYSPVPEEAPFELNVGFEEKPTVDEPRLSLQLAVHNLINDSLMLGTTGGYALGYNFVITTLDSILVWRRLGLGAGMNPSALGIIELEPNEEKIFTTSWAYVGTNKNRVKPGRYLVYGGLNSVELLEPSEKIYGNLGTDPDTLLVNQF